MVAQVHGVADVWKVTTTMAKDERQSVLVRDESGHVRLSLSACSYPVMMTPEEARFVARALQAAARRIEKLGAPK